MKKTSTQRRAPRLNPPIPHEHGAWVILYVPLLIGLAAARSFQPAPALLLVLAVTGAYLARHAAALRLRRRDKDDTSHWLSGYLAALAAGGIPLIVCYHRTALLWLGVIGAGVFALHSLLMVRSGRRRLDRSASGEAVGVAALCLTGPAAWVALRGSLAPEAWYLWVASTLYFTSSIYYVKMLLSAVKLHANLTDHIRWRLAAANLGYHGVLMAAVVVIAGMRGGQAGSLIVIAYLPVLLRAFSGTLRLSSKAPSLKRVGIAEMVYALWFALFFTTSMLLAG